MKWISHRVLAVLILAMATAGLLQAQSPSAWAELLEKNPAATDDPNIGWKDRLILDALTPEQATAYFSRGAEPDQLIVQDGRTLKEYLDSKLSPPATGYVPLPGPCRLFSSEQVEARLPYSLRTRGVELGTQGGSPGGCGIPADASALMVQIRLDSAEGPARVKLWAADDPEPAASALASLDAAFGPAESTVVVPLSEALDVQGDLRLLSSARSSVHLDAVGYFRTLRAGDYPGGGVMFSVESDSTNSFGTGAGTTGLENSFFGAYAGTGNSGDQNSFFGASAGAANSGDLNSFFGGYAGYQNTTGNTNSFVGYSSGYSNTTGYRNSAFGSYAGFTNSTGDENSTFGWNACADTTGGNGNTCLGAYTAGDHDTTNGTAIGFRAQVSQSNSLVLGSINGINGATSDVKVGIGTTTPSEALHVVRSDGTAMIKVEETSSTTQNRVLFRLTNNGAPWFKLLNSNTAEEWTFAMDQYDNFIFSRIGTGGAEFKIYKDGTVVMGPGGSEVFTLSPNGDLSIDGNLTANGVVYASDRDKKTDIESLEGGRVLEAVAKLPVSTWRFKTEDAEIRHAGPMAQDFYAAFGLGTDEKTISASDISGVALAAIQGLIHENLETKAQLTQKENELTAQQMRIQELEARVGELEGLRAELRAIQRLLRSRQAAASPSAAE